MKNEAEKHEDSQKPFWRSLLYILERHGPESGDLSPPEGVKNPQKSALGRLLGCLVAVLGRLGPSWRALETCWRLLEASWSVLERLGRSWNSQFEK